MINPLSHREQEVLRLIAYENTNDEIAAKLYISSQTVKTHRRNLLGKLSVKNTAGLVRRSIELGIVQLEQPNLAPQPGSTNNWMFGNQNFIRVASVLGLLIFCFSFPLKAQNDIELIFLQQHITGRLVNVPGFVNANGGFYPASWNTVDVNTFPFTSWVKAESYGTYNTRLDYTLREDTSNTGDVVTIQVLYHKNFGTPEQTTKKIGEQLHSLFYVGPLDGFTQKNHSIALDLDSLDGTQMGVIECIYKVTGVQMANAEIPMVVTGLVTRDVATAGSLVTPQIPYLILHDPPGDGSSSTFEGGKKICRTTSTTYQEESGGGFTATGKIGLAGSIGVILSQDFEFSVSVTQDFMMTETKLTEMSNERCIEISNSFSTSALPGATGEDADLFIGYGETWVYGIFEELILPTLAEIVGGEDSARVKKGFAYAKLETPGATTTFIKTAPDIQADIQAQMNIANNMANSQLIRTRAFNQAKVWQDVLALNASNIANASELIDNYNTSGGPQSTFTEKITTTQMTNISYDVAIETGTGVEIVAVVGANGFTGGPQFTFNKNEGMTTTDANETSKLISYTFSDDDALDNFPISAYRDPTYGTPIFRLNNGARTSCPYEGGYRRDQPRLSANWSSGGTASCQQPGLTDLFVDNVPRNQFAIFNLNVCNDADEIRTYVLELTNNDKGAVVKAGNTDLNNTNNVVEYLVAAGQCNNIVLSIGRNQADAPAGYNNPNLDFYNDLTLRLYPDCSGMPEEGEAVPITITVSYGGVGNFPSCGIACPDIDGDGIENCADLCFQNNDAALDFDQAGGAFGDPNADQVLVPNNALLNNLVDGDFAFAAWIYPTDQSNATILAKGNGSTFETVYIFGRSDGFALNNPGKIALFLADGTNGQWTYSNTTVPLNTWSHVAVSYNSSQKKASFFLNGLPDGEYSYTAPTGPLFKTDSGPLYIGRQGTVCNCNFFNGSMDELVIWSKVLTEQDVASLMATALAGTEANLIAYYTFNEVQPCVANGSNTTLTDLTANNLDGALTNFALTIGCTSNWTSGSNKVRHCAGCMEFMDISAATGVLDGIYSASNQITIKPGTQFVVGKNITLSAPTVLFETDNTVPATTILTINQDGCQN